MTDDQIRIAMAECLGWTDVHDAGLSAPHELIGIRLNCSPTLIPDFPDDLNAVHEAEKTFESQSEWEEYEAHLNTQVHSFFLNRHLIHATARQRCEAYLRVKGQWKE